MTHSKSKIQNPKSPLPRYERYKDSGVEWLGDVPEHWESERVFSSFNERVETGHADLPNLNITIGRGVQVEEFEGARKKRLIEDLNAYKRAAKGDIAYNTMRMWQGAVGDVPVDGLVSPAYVVARPIKPINSRFYSYLFRTETFQTETNRHSYGIVSDRNRLYWLGFKNITIPIPSRHEQDRIAAFLDQKTAEIDALIAKKQRQIELLDEQKAIIINRAVTRGHNSNAKLKPSGIEWIGEIPEHWEVSSIRRQASFVTSGSRGWAQYSSPTGPLFLRICNLSRGSLELRLEDIERVLPPRGSEGERTEVTGGDVLVSITAFIGSIGVVPDGFEEAYVSQHIALVRLKPSGTHPKWIGYALLSELGAIQSNLMMYGGTKVGLSLGDVKNYCFPVPPQNEQVEILEHITAVLSGYTKGVSQFQKEIKSLKTLRSALIAHAVTGRIKV